MQYLSVKNWDEFQHYKDRNPPWIKLHNQLLEDFDYACLPDASKSHLIAIWLLASRTNNKIPADKRWVAAKIGANTEVDLKLLIESGFLVNIQQDTECYQGASKTLQESALPACLETEGETEGEKRRRRFTPPTLEEVAGYCNERKNNVDPQRFIDHYEANGWVRGKTKIKDWKACVRTWEKSNGKNKQSSEFRTPVQKVQDTFAELRASGKGLDGGGSDIR